MKKVNLILFMVLGIITIAFAQVEPEPETTNAFWRFYNKYATAIWLVIGTSGVAVFFWARVQRLQNAIKVLMTAGDDTSPQGRIITQEEWNGIIAAFKNIFGKLTEEEKNKIVQDVKRKS